VTYIHETGSPFREYTTRSSLGKHELSDSASHHSSHPSSIAATIGSSYPPLPLYTNTYGMHTFYSLSFPNLTLLDSSPGTSLRLLAQSKLPCPIGRLLSTYNFCSSYGHSYNSYSYDYQQQTSRGVAFPTTSNQHSPYPAQGPAIVIHHSSHHSKSKHSDKRQRRHSHTGANVPVVRPSVPQVPIYSGNYTSGGSRLKPALVHHSNSQQNLQHFHHRPSQSNLHVAFQTPPSSSSKPSKTHTAPAPPKYTHYSKCDGRRKALCVSHLDPYTLAFPADSVGSRTILDWYQLYWPKERAPWMCKRR
jgi:hypothetical protein